MTRTSLDLTDVVGRFLSAYQDRDLETLKSLLDPSTHLRVIGTDPREWWKAYEPTIALMEAQYRELQPFELVIDELEAFEDGDVGWAAVRADVRFASGVVRPYRLTVTFVRFESTWRVVQWHGSVGRFNEESFGVELTTSLENLLVSLTSGGVREIDRTIRQGTVTLVFTDIEGSTQLAEKLGDGPWSDLIRWHDEALRGIVKAAGGTVVKSLGDGAMLAFDSARSALHAAVEIQEAMSRRDEQPLFKVRVGVHAGETMRTETDYFGLTVSKAARIAAAAAGGEIMTSRAVQELVGNSAEFDFGPPIELELRGISGTHTAAQLRW